MICVGLVAEPVSADDNEPVLVDQDGSYPVLSIGEVQQVEREFIYTATVGWNWANLPANQPVDFDNGVTIGGDTSRPRTMK